MKKLFGYIAVAALVLSACSKPANDLTAEENEIVRMKHVVFGAEIVGDDVTRATIDDAAKFSWESGDKVAVYATDGNFHEFTVTGTGLVASIEGDILETAEVTTLAVYPYSAAKDVNTITLPSEYSYDDSKNRRFFPMVAKFDEGYEGTLHFEHVTAGLEISFTKIPSVATHFVVTTDAPCAGELNINTGVITNNASTTIKVPTNDEGSDRFFVPIPAGTFNLNVALNTGAPNTVKVITESEKEKSTTFTANKIKRFGTINIPNIPYDPIGYGEGAVVFVTGNDPLSIYKPEDGSLAGQEGQVDPSQYAVNVMTVNGNQVFVRDNNGTTEYLTSDGNSNGGEFQWTTTLGNALQCELHAHMTGEEVDYYYYFAQTANNPGHRFVIIIDSTGKIVFQKKEDSVNEDNHVNIIYVNYPDSE